MNVERKIVVNLAWRYRQARKHHKQALATENETLINNNLMIASEAWNAYEASRRILYGVKL